MSLSQPRHIAREYALRVLYALDLQTQAGLEQPVLPSSNWWKEDDKLHVSQNSESFCRTLIQSVRKNQHHIDCIIKEHSHNWRLERMSPIDRNILRLSVSELMYNTKTPPNVIINEAVELAKCYGDTNSSKFLNGILDALVEKVSHPLDDPICQNQDSQDVKDKQEI